MPVYFVKFPCYRVFFMAICTLPKGKTHYTEGDMKNQLQLNQTVKNLGILAKIVGFHKITGDPILRPFWNDGTRWLATAALCQVVDEHTVETQGHKNGLVNLG